MVSFKYAIPAFSRNLIHLAVKNWFLFTLFLVSVIQFGHTAGSTFITSFTRSTYFIQLKSRSYYSANFETSVFKK